MAEDWQRRLNEVAFNYSAKNEPLSGIAVSGGSDSLAMLYLLAEKGWPIAAATVDHQLREGSRTEAEVVAEHCERLSVPHTILTWDRPDLSGNLQDKARRARYRLLSDWARETGFKTISLAHTMDDQAETFLMRVARGSGIDGLCGMSGYRVDQDITWMRPFLTTRREELRAYLSSRNVAWIDDPSNEDEGFDRIKARKALKMLEPLGLDAEKIWDVTFNLQDVRSEMDYRARGVFESSGREDHGDLVFEGAATKASQLGHETRRRMINAALLWVSGADYPPRKEAALDLSIAISKGIIHTLSGCVVTSSDDIRFAREFNAVKDLKTPTTQLWDGRWHLSGPHAPDLVVRALGEAVKDTPWRDTGLPRQSLLASPAVWQGETLIAAPVAGLANGWTAQATGRGNFNEFLLRR